MKYVGSMSYCACDGVGFVVACSSLHWLLVSESVLCVMNVPFNFIRYELTP